MPLKLRVETKPPRFIGKIPLLRTVLKDRSLKQVSRLYTQEFEEAIAENTAPGSGRLVKSRRIQGNVKPTTEVDKRGASLGVELTGSSETQGIIAVNEYGTRGKGGRLPSIRPKAAKVLAIPNQKQGAGRTSPRQHAGAVWVPRGRDTLNPLLVALAPAKKKVGPNHKKPNQFMSPSRKVERVLMFGKQKVDIRPKFFIRNAFFRASLAVRKEMPQTTQRIVREILE